VAIQESRAPYVPLDCFASLAMTPLVLSKCNMPRPSKSLFGIVVETVEQLQKAIGNGLDNHGVIHRLQLISDILVRLRVSCGER
jgi:hypothetical protein